MPDLPGKLAKLNRALRMLAGMGSSSPQGLIEAILDVVDEVFGRDTAALLLVEPDGRHLRIAASRGYEASAVAAYQGVVGEGIAGWVAAHGESRLVQDVSREGGYIPAVANASSEMAVPLVAEGRVIGVLDVESRNGFDEEDMALFTAFGEHAAWALRHRQALSASQERARRMELLHTARLALNDAKDPRELLGDILVLAHQALGFERVAILLQAGADGPLVVRKSQGREGVQGQRIMPGEGIAGHVFASGKAERIPDITLDPRYLSLGVKDERSEMAVPLVLEGKAIGVLDATSRLVDAFDALDLEIFSAFAAQVATALKHAQQLAEIRSQAKRLSLVVRAGRALNSLRDLDDRLDEILRAADEALGLGRVALLLLDPASQELVVRTAMGYGDVIGKRIPLGREITGRVGRSGRAELIRNVELDPDYCPGVVGGRTEMAVPLKLFGELIGVLDTESTVADAFNDRDLEIFKAFGDQVAVAIHNTRLFRGLEEANARLQSNVNEMSHLNFELEGHGAAIKEANRNLEIQIRQLTTLHQAGQAITSSLDLNKTLEAILKMTAGIVNSSAGAIKLIDEETQELRIKAQAGATVLEMELEGPSYRVDLPLRIGEKTIGVFELIRSAAEEMGDGERKMLETLASQASIAIENARLFEDTQRTYHDTLKTLARAIEARDDYTRGHSERVAELALATGEALGLGEEDCSVIFNAALLHDIGKIGVRDSVLLSDKALTDAERVIINEHPTHSNTILGPLKFLGKVAEFVKHHHEAWDGSGYPNGLKGEAIPFFSRIITVADAYDAMTSIRPYRKARTHAEAMEEIARMSGRQFDPKIVDVFLRVMAVGRT